jgi:UDP-MurNAc hydroxylase
MKLQFINHASYIIENDNFIFITDPWLEGAAFNDGWRLLDKSTSNLEMVNHLKVINKKTFIWYSHEHSDHFSISFIKLAKSQNIDLHVLFQNSVDRRVFDFIKKNSITISVLENGEIFKLSHNCSFKIWTWKSGDSFSILNLNGFHVLNLNDCIVKNEDDALHIKNLIELDNSDDIDILFTQFGYASWCGNENNKENRRNQAMEKCDRLVSQISILKPKATILFASFVYFSHEKNFYLNDEQNTPLKIRKTPILNNLSQNIFFLKPKDLIDLNSDFVVSLNNLTLLAERHWQGLIENIKPDELYRQTVCDESIFIAFQKYKKRIEKNFLYIFTITEILGFIKCIRIKINDLNKVAQLSYIHGLHFDERIEEFDLSMRSDVLFFTIDREYGFDSTHVGGRFRVGNSKGDIKAMYFFGPQNLLKNGFGINAPIKTIKEFQ